jgi:hypothetical protein
MPKSPFSAAADAIGGHPTQTIAFGSGCCDAAGCLAHCKGASLSDAAGAVDRRLWRWLGALDIVARLIGQSLSEQLGQSFVVE